MDRHRLRNLIPLVYAALIIVGFLISSTVGVIVSIAGAMISGALWSTLGGVGGEDTVRGRERAAARAARRDRRR
jgi:hypothetical protein